MTLILILNAILAVAIVAAMVALHSRAIVAERRYHGTRAEPDFQPAQLARPTRVAPAQARAGAAGRAPRRRRPTLVTD